MDEDKVIGKCKTCKFWNFDNYSCDQVSRGPDGFRRVSKEPDDLFRIDAYANDDQGLEVELRVGPEFGCVKHEDESIMKNTFGKGLNDL